jgi:hypothetical protein
MGPSSAGRRKLLLGAIGTGGRIQVFEPWDFAVRHAEQTKKQPLR